LAGSISLAGSCLLSKKKRDLFCVRNFQEQDGRELIHPERLLQDGTMRVGGGNAGASITGRENEGAAALSQEIGDRIDFL
jgi:hypothetical protein